MRMLLPTFDEDVDVHSWYAADWLDRSGLRVNFVASVDGAATGPDHRARGLQTPGDNRVFAALRDLADVVLVGAGTVRVEGYGPVRISARRAAQRREHGLAPVLPIAVISARLDLDPAGALFTAAPADARTIVLTCAGAPAERRAALEPVADVLICGTDTVDLALAVAALHEHGLTRILSEGGPHTFARLHAAAQVDELCLSITPKLIGRAPLAITSNDVTFDHPAELSLTGLLEEDGALFLRYRIPTTERYR